ncbi:MAG: type II toxin-antitoxin system RelE/ParE family toxin [Alphaproteobacteria bacterium]
MRPVLWSELALAELDNQVAYISKHNPQVAIKIPERLFKLAEMLSEFPKLGSEYNPPNIRQLHVNGLPFVIVYRIKPSAIQILHLYHTRQERL